MRDKELKMMFGKHQEEMSKAPLAASVDLSNEFKSITFGTDQRNVSSFMWLIWEEQQKYLESSQINATCHPRNPDTDVRYQTFILLILTSFLSTSFMMFHIPFMKLAQNCLSNSGKGKCT